MCPITLGITVLECSKLPEEDPAFDEKVDRHGLVPCYK